MIELFKKELETAFSKVCVVKSVTHKFNREMFTYPWIGISIEVYLPGQKAQAEKEIPTAIYFYEFKVDRIEESKPYWRHTAHTHVMKFISHILNDQIIDQPAKNHPNE